MTTTNSGSTMNLIPPNETRRAVGVRRWAACIGRILLPAGLFGSARNMADKLFRKAARKAVTFVNVSTAPTISRSLPL